MRELLAEAAGILREEAGSLQASIDACTINNDWGRELIEQQERFRSLAARLEAAAEPADADEHVSEQVAQRKITRHPVRDVVTIPKPPHVPSPAEEPTEAEVEGVTALLALVEACEAEAIKSATGDDPPDVPISYDEHGEPSEITFGLVVAARAALRALRHGPQTGGAP